MSTSAANQISDLEKQVERDEARILVMRSILRLTQQPEWQEGPEAVWRGRLEAVTQAALAMTTQDWHAHGCLQGEADALRTCLRWRGSLSSDIDSLRVQIDRNITKIQALRKLP